MRIDHPAPNDIPLLKRLWMEVFGDSESYLDLFFTTGFSISNCLLCRDDGEISAALYWMDMDYPGGKLAYIYAVATDPARRGKGLCRALLTKAHAILAQRGYAGAILVPQGEDLFALYRKFGYRNCCGIREFTAAAAAPTPLRRLDAETYALRRKALLPQAVQPGAAALKLLAASAEFYEGDGVLLACVREGKKLFAPEYLGQEALAGGVIATLSCREGRLRTPGNDTPFAMFLPLQNNAPVPSHLGFAFD